MIAIPEEIIHVIDHDEEGNMVLKESATEKQQEVFKKFQNDLEEGDTSLIFEE